jgi:hypothetical protein
MTAATRSTRVIRGGLLPEHPAWIDRTTLGEYPFLTDRDRCLFFGEFHGHRGWTAGPINRLIADFKRPCPAIGDHPMARRLRHYREQAIGEVAAALRRHFTREEIETRCTFVPIPPSKLPDDTEYCDRLERALRQAFAGSGADIRLLLRQTSSIVADHRRGSERIRYEKLLEITQLDPRELALPLRPVVILFDDVLTTGKHYKVAATRIREALPRQQIVALFVARCIHIDAILRP